MIQWFKVVDATLNPPPPPRYVILPYHGSPMWSQYCYDYYQCPKCAKLLISPQCRIGIQFISTRWRVVLFCNECVEIEESSKCGIPVIEIETLLKPILDRGCRKVDHNCVVCGDWKCTNEQCDQVYEQLQRSELDDLFEHFINIKLDIITPLRYAVCNGCNVTISGKQYTCDICRYVCYCSKKCKRSCANHHCTDYWNCWIY